MSWISNLFCLWGKNNSAASAERDELNRQAEEITSLHEELTSVHNMIDSRNAELTSVNAELTSVEQELGRRTEELASVRAELASVEQELGRRTEELTSVRAELESSVEYQKRFEDLVKENADLLREYDALRANLSEELQDFAQNIIDRLQESLESVGLTRIDGEASFNISRHKAVPAGTCETGTPIVRTIEPGLAYGDRVLRRAKVEVQVNQE